MSLTDDDKRWLQMEFDAQTKRLMAALENMRTAILKAFTDANDDPT